MAATARVIGVVASVLVIGQYLAIAAQTIGYPYQLEWMEGGVVDVVGRVVAGESIYTAPSVEYVPYLYPPLFFYVAAAVASVTGVELAPVRWVSFVALLGVGLFLYQIVVRETRKPWVALGAVALFVASYELTGRWFHLARVDMLHLLFFVAAFHRLRFGTGWRSAATAGALLFAAFLTKQTALPFAVPLLSAAFVFDARRAAIASSVFAGATLVGSLVLGAATGGWFLYYVFELPAQHAYHFDLALPAMVEHFWKLGPAIAAALVAVVVLWRIERRVGVLYAGVLAAGVVSSVTAFAHAGGYLNVVMPLCLAVALAAPSCLRGRVDPKVALVAAVALAGQLFLLTGPTAASLPPPGAVQSGDRFVAFLASRQPEILVPDLRFVQTRAGHRSHGLGMAARDVLRADRSDPARRMLTESLAHALSERRFSTVILSQPDWLDGVVAFEYRQVGTVTTAPSPITGHRTRPLYVWVPKDAR